MATLRLVRHATLLLDYGGKRLLVDPVLSQAGALDPSAPAADSRRNPLVELPVPLSEVLGYEECLVTHLHRDHFDAAALSRLPRERPVICQPEDQARLEKEGFREVVAVGEAVRRGELEIARTAAEHGRGEMLPRMGPGCGFVLRHPAEPALYLTGDTVYCPAVQEALARHRPEAVVVNAGAAQFTQGGPITMDAEGVVALARAAPLAQVIVVHMEAWNHCLLGRAELKRVLDDEGLSDRVLVPDDGEELVLG